MKTFLFASACLLAILLASAAVVVATGAIDHHFGYLGSILETIIPSMVATVVLSIAFLFASMYFKGERSFPVLMAAGGAAGVLAHLTAWVLAEPLQDIHALAILLPYVVVGMLASAFSRPRKG